MKFVRINGENHAGYALLDIVEHKTSKQHDCGRID